MNVVYTTHNNFSFDLTEIERKRQKKERKFKCVFF
jgi:hypothetical protein